MNKIFVCIIIIALSVSLTACGGSEESKSPAQSTPEQTQSSAQTQTDQSVNGSSKHIETYPYEKLPLYEDAQIQSAIKTGNQGGKIVFTTQSSFEAVCDYYKGVMNEYARYMETETDEGLYLFAESDPHRLSVEILSSQGGEAVKVTVIAGVMSK